MSKLTVAMPSTFWATWIRQFLKRLEVEVPPPVGNHHTLRYAQYGSDETGWEDMLCLNILFSNGSRNYFLFDIDLVENPVLAAKRVAATIALPIEGVPAAGVR